LLLRFAKEARRKKRYQRFSLSFFASFALLLRFAKEARRKKRRREEVDGRFSIIFYF